MTDLAPIPGRALCRASKFPDLAKLDEAEEDAVIARMASLGHETHPDAVWDLETAFDALDFVRPRIIRPMPNRTRRLSGW